MDCKIVNNAGIDLRDMEQHIHGMYRHFDDQIGFKKPPVMVFDSDPGNATKTLGKTAYYDPQTFEVHVYVDGRHPKDMLRSIAHELIHHQQNLEGRLDVGGYHGEGYYLKNKGLQKLEQEAMSRGNELMREYEDQLKLKKENKMSTKDWKNKELFENLNKKWGFKFNPNALNESKEITHMCALHVTHKASGKEGHPIRHTLSESGDISHYTVEFDDVIVENIAVENLNILVQEEHTHKKGDEKPHDKDKPVMSEEELEMVDCGDKGRVPKYACDGKGADDLKKDAGKAGKEDGDKKKKDLSKVPPQLRKHVAGKKEEKEEIEEASTIGGGNVQGHSGGKKKKPTETEKHRREREANDPGTKYRRESMMREVKEILNNNKKIREIIKNLKEK